MLGFVKKYPPIIFFNTIRILEVEVRKDWGTPEFSTSYSNYIAFYKEEAEVQKPALLSVPAR